MNAAMHKRLLLLGVLAAAVILVPGTHAARAQTPIRHSLYQHYIDPFSASGWEPARTDMGVDWFVLPGGTDTEWGWGEANGATRANACYHEGEVTRSGREMARFMMSLGAQVAEAPGRGADAPFGSLC